MTSSPGICICGPTLIIPGPSLHITQPGVASIVETPDVFHVVKEDLDSTCCACTSRSLASHHFWKLQMCFLSSGRILMRSAVLRAESLCGVRICEAPN